jgi:protein TonB
MVSKLRSRVRVCALVLATAASALAQTQPAPQARERPAPAAAQPQPPAPAAQGLRPHQQRLEAFAREVVRRFRQSLQQGIAYPPEALANRWEGTAWITVVYVRGGAIKDIVLDKSSGHDVLDQFALQAARAADLPQAPEELRWREFDITFPVSFRLDSAPPGEPR